MKKVQCPKSQNASNSLHLAIIMDGNGRWAAQRGLPRLEGHRRGVQAAHSIVKFCPELGISHLTLYAFSSENWERSHDEVEALMRLLRHYLDHEMRELHGHGVRLLVIGDRTRLAADIVDKIEKAEALTAANDKLTLCLALSYGSRDEITATARLLASRVAAGTLKPEDIDEDIFAAHLQTASLPSLDILVRPGNVMRVSNFLLWQLAYTELFFPNILWPDFTPEDLTQIVQSFHARERRYGKRKEDAA
jgi:undecaprenyl diphosphate synthase